MKTLLYFEDSVESTFGYLDIAMLAPNFEQVILFANNKEHLALYPDSCKVVSDYMNWSAFSVGRLIVRHFTEVCKAMMASVKVAGFSVNRWKKMLKRIVSNIFRANAIESQLAAMGVNVSEAVAYSFWFYDPLFLVFLKMRYPELVTINRAHGGDIYEGQSTLKHGLLLRRFELKYLDRVITVAKDGADYLKKRYPAFADKITHHYLGIKGGIKANAFPKEIFTIVTCSHVRDVKRVDLIADTILKLDFPVTWYHIGDENPGAQATDETVANYWLLRPALFAKKGLTFIPKGVLTQKEVYDFYEQTPVSLLLSLSSTEGLPVSMMEAISFGIPVMATDVGGCREVATEQTGVLLAANPTADEAAKAIQAFVHSTWNTPEIREQIRAFWAENFNAEINYPRFIQLIAKA